jgi:hypothetical protein
MSLTFTRRASLIAGASALVAAAAPASAARSARSPEADRVAIRAMAGDYRVRFNFRETTAFVGDYTPLEPKTSGGHESVRVIADEGDFLSLQHLLVASHEGKPFVIKHWRQDWTYEPREVLVYERLNTWGLRAVSRRDRQGAWAQTVWQTDDSPRYGGVGRWVHGLGRSLWTSNDTLRPLARRDAIRNPPYDHYRAINRHAITPSGWVHEQDNEKIGLRDGAPVVIVHEDGVNTYERFGDYAVAAADAYWSDTSAYWAGVRQAWDKAAARHGGVVVQEEAQSGVVTGPMLMGLAERIHADEIDPAAALAQARLVIATHTSAPKQGRAG